jgi:hypothetical protein
MSDQHLLDAKRRAREAEREKNRAEMPNLAALVDEMREQFPGAKLIWGEDLVTGKSVGVKPDESNGFDIPPNYFPMREVNTGSRRNRRE